MVIRYKHLEKLVVIKEVMDRIINDGCSIDIIGGDDCSIDEFDELIECLEFTALRVCGYKMVTHNRDNMQFFHIPGVLDSGLSIYRVGKVAHISKISVESIIWYMSDKDIKLNELLNDSDKLRGNSLYDARVRVLGKI